MVQIKCEDKNKFLVFSSDLGVSMLIKTFKWKVIRLKQGCHLIYEKINFYFRFVIKYKCISPQLFVEF